MRRELHVLAALVNVFAIVQATPSPIWVQPSGSWVGDNGNWSAHNFLVGGQGDQVSLLVSTGLSQFVAVESSGCVGSSSPVCRTARGGTFGAWTSRSWHSIGSFPLSVDDSEDRVSADYGLDTVVATNTLEGRVTSLDNVLIAAINDTEYYQGFIGIGNAPVKLDGRSANSIITQAAQTYSLIASSSYGYTAGAWYGSAGSGTPSSLVLGGYDPLRFIPSNVDFDFNPNSTSPELLLRGINIASTDGSTPVQWNDSSKVLMAYNNTNVARIDTTTPYLWLPVEVCNVFAAVLNLTWSDKYGVYTFEDSSDYISYVQDTPYEFTFSFSSFDNRDDFGRPLQVPGVVNITISSAAFAQLLRYPFDNVALTDPAVPYFPLKPTNGTIIIGRSFMQEAYLITQYDVQTFSLNQALFPDNGNHNYSTIGLDALGKSYVPAVAAPAISTGEIAGIAVGLFLGLAVGIGLLWKCCFRRKGKRLSRRSEQRIQEEIITSLKDDSSEVDTCLYRSRLSRIWSRKHARRRNTPTKGAHEVHGETAEPNVIDERMEDDAVYELPDQDNPVELDNTEAQTAQSEDQASRHNDQPLSEYELAQRNLLRQISQLSRPTNIMYDDKNDESSPVSPHSYDNTMPSEPSPTSPRTNQWTGLITNLPSPTTYLPSPFPSPSLPEMEETEAEAGSSVSPVSGFPYSPDDYNSMMFPKRRRTADLHIITSTPQRTRALRSSESVRLAQPNSPVASQLMSRSISNQDHASTTPTTQRVPSSPQTPISLQRSPIEPSRIVCLGPLPGNIRLPHHYPSIPSLVSPKTASSGSFAGAAARWPPKSASSAGPSTSPTVPRSTIFEANNATRSTSSPTTEKITPPPKALLAHNPNNQSRESLETLGSDYTIEEETRTQQQQEQQHEEEHLSRQLSQHEQGRIDGEMDMVHVPQVAAKRYSWEEP